MELLSHDILVIGGGLAGLRAALEAKKEGLDVAVLSKVHPLRSHSVAAQGGINAALGNAPSPVKDSWENHAFDTIKGSDYLADQDAVEVMCQEGIDRVVEMEHWGTLFSRTEDGKIAQRPFGGAGFPRACYAADRTGHNLLHTLYEQVTALRIPVYEEWYALTLVVKDGRCIGILALHFFAGEIIPIRAKVVVLATGGYGRIYLRSTNAVINTGSGISLAYEAGASLKDMEFVQFHPTSLYLPSAPHFLLSESMRGEGAVLLNARKRRFMENYAPMAELAPRDVVSRAIISEMVKTDSNHVYLDVRHMGKEFVKKRFPRIHATCLLYGIDITEDLIPVSPAAHYFMGGVKTNLDGETNIRGLYAAGEVACTGVHGANRLASNSLLEGLVFGARAGKAALRSAVIPDETVDYHLTPNVVEETESIRTALRKVMWEKAGIIRCAVSLNEAKKRLYTWKKITEGNFLTRAELELKNMITISGLIVEAALSREGSVGAHYRSDHKEKGKDWQSHRRWDRDTFKFAATDTAHSGRSACR